MARLATAARLGQTRAHDRTMLVATLLLPDPDPDPAGLCPCPCPCQPSHRDHHRSHLSPCGTDRSVESKGVSLAYHGRLALLHAHGRAHPLGG